MCLRCSRYAYARELAQALEPLRDMPQLQALMLTYAPLAGMDWQAMPWLQQLTHFGLAEIRTADDDWSWLASMEGLEGLTLHDAAQWNKAILAALPTLKHLSYLDLSYNKSLKDISALSSLVGLTSLNLQNAGLSDLKFLEPLTGLTALDLGSPYDGNENSFSDVSVLSSLVGLTSLNLSRTRVSDVSVLSSLVGLTSLNLQNAGLSDLKFLEPLTGLTALDLGSPYDGNENSFSDVSVLSSLVGLTSLNLSWNKKLSDVSVLSSLAGLTSLNLASTRVSDLSVLSSLVGLTSLNLENCNVTNIQPLRPLLERGLRPSLKQYDGDIRLYGNPLKTPPREIVRKGTEKVLEYLYALAGGPPRPLNEVKVLLVGDGAAGKTSLSKQLRGKRFSPRESTTHGITIAPFTLQVSDQKITTHLWDFGGQEVMHATHQFFLSKRSLYLLVLDGRKDEKTEYWLKHIQAFGGDSPVLVVLNKIDQNPGFELNRKTLLEKYPQIAGFYKVSCAKKTGLVALQEALQQEIDKLEIVKHPFPGSWWQVKEWINKHKEPQITIQEFRTQCHKHSIFEEGAQDLLAEFLDDLGLALSFEHDKKTLVFDPEWLTQAVYRIINDALVPTQQGIIKQQDLAELLRRQHKREHHYASEWHAYIMGLMVTFELCYPIANQGAWLVPDLLPESEPETTLAKAEGVRFYFQYDFLPRAIFPRLLVQRHQELAQDGEGRPIQWRTGCELNFKGTQARVVVDYEDRQVKLHVKGPGAKEQVEYLTRLRDTLEGIHNSLSQEFRANTQAMVPVPGYKAAIPYQELVDFEAMGYTTIKVPGYRQNVPVKKLLEGIDPPEKRMEQQQEKGDGIHIDFKPHIEIKDVANPKIGVDTSSEATAKAKNENTISVEVQQSITEALQTIKRLAEDLEDELSGSPSEASALKKLTRATDNLTALNNAESEDKVNKDTLDSLAHFLEGLNDAETPLGKALRKVRNGLQRGKDLAGYCKTIAEGLGLLDFPTLNFL